MSPAKQCALVVLVVVFLTSAVLNVPLTGVPAVSVLTVWGAMAAFRKWGPDRENPTVLLQMGRPERAEPAPAPVADDGKPYRMPPEFFDREWREAIERYEDWARPRRAPDAPLIPADAVLHLDREFKPVTHCRFGHLGPFYLAPAGDDRVVRTCPVDGSSWTERR